MTPTQRIIKMKHIKDQALDRMLAAADRYIEWDGDDPHAHRRDGEDFDAHAFVFCVMLREIQVERL